MVETNLADEGKEAQPVLWSASQQAELRQAHLTLLEESNDVYVKIPRLYLQLGTHYQGGNKATQVGLEELQDKARGQITQEIHKLYQAYPAPDLG